MHMLSKTDLSSAELETFQRSRNPTTVITANGEVQTIEEATVYIHDLELFVAVQIHDETLAVLSLGRLCEEHGYSYEWTSGQKTTADQDWDKFCVIRKTSCLLLLQDCRQDPQARAQVRPPHRYRRTRLVVSLSQRSDDTHARASRNRGDPTKNQNKNNNMDNSQAPSNRVRDLRVWLVEFTENLEDTEVPALRDTPRKHFSRFRFGTSC